MSEPITAVIECDVLIVGGGMSGCGAAVEAKYWGKGLKVIMVDKAATERSGATGEGLSAREGRWQIMIHGEAIKPIIAEAARNALGAENMYDRVFIHVRCYRYPSGGRGEHAAGQESSSAGPRLRGTLA